MDDANPFRSGCCFAVVVVSVFALAALAVFAGLISLHTH